MFSASRIVWLILIAAAALRLAAMRGDLHIDEIWSWWFVKHAIRRAIDVLALRHDNNHPLNTLIMYAIGPDAAGVWYRVPAVVASTLTVGLAGVIAWRRGRANALFAMLLVGGSYLMILYGSEARGYAYGLCLAFVMWELLLRTAERRGWMELVGAAIAGCLGLLSHLTFVYALAGCWVWAVLLWRKQPVWRPMFALLAPTLLAGGMYVTFIRGMAIGGGPELPLFMALVQSLSIAGGGPLFGDLALGAASAVVLLVGIGLWQRSSTDIAQAAGLLTTLVIAPALVLAATGHALVYPRYFFIPIGFALLVAADVLADAWRRAGWRRGAAGVLLLAYLIGNGWWTVRLLDHGRGDYSAALEWMADQASEQPTTIQADHDFRIGMIYGYDAARLGLDGERLRYVEQRALPPAGTDFLVLHDFEGDEPYPQLVTDRYGNRYQLGRIFRHQSLSGYNWWVYRRLSEPRTPSAEKITPGRESRVPAFGTAI